MTTTEKPKRLTFNLVNDALKSRPGYAGEVLVQGNGYLYFMEGNASAWRGGSSIPVCRLGHTSLKSILADFDQFVRDHAEQENSDLSSVGGGFKVRIVGDESEAAPAAPATAPANPNDVEVEVGGKKFLVTFKDGKAARVRTKHPALGWSHVWGERDPGMTPRALSAIRRAEAVLSERAAAQAQPSPADALMALASAQMLEQFKDSHWYKTSPDGRNGVEPVITITGIEHRNVTVTMGILSMGEEMRPFLIGRVEIAGISAKLTMSIQFGHMPLRVEEGE